MLDRCKLRIEVPIRLASTIKSPVEATRIVALNSEARPFRASASLVFSEARFPRLLETHRLCAVA